MTTVILAIDPGTAESAFVVLDGERLRAHGTGPNAAVKDLIASGGGADVLAIEMVASYGMPVGREVFETCVWIGRFVEAWGAREHELVYRRDVKLHLCGHARAKDSNVRQALLDRWGGRDAAIGRKAKPGPLYGVSGDVWQALAVAVTSRRCSAGSPRCPRVDLSTV